MNCELPIRSVLTWATGQRSLFENHKIDDDCLVGFDGTPWHTHGDLMLIAPRGSLVTFDALNIITGLVEGMVLICETSVNGELADRQLAHRDYIDIFRHMRSNEVIRVRRAGSTPNLRIFDGS